MLKIVALALCAAMLSACFEAEPVDYTLSCSNVTCPNATDTSNFNSGGSYNFTCTWYCHEYGGFDAAYVSLSFWSWDGGCWELDSEYVDPSGICN